MVLINDKKIDNSTEKNTMPVCESEVEIEVPRILGNVPEIVNVAINKLEATNGETNENNSFSCKRVRQEKVHCHQAGKNGEMQAC